MTVIAYRSGAMAGDCQMSWGNTKVHYPKVRIVGRFIVGCAGEVGAMERFFKWLASDQSKDPNFTKDDDFDALVLNDQGNIQAWDRHMASHPLTEEFFAIGSGAKYAIGAMERGATAEEAVAVACKWDTGCGGKIVKFSIADLKPKRKGK